MSQPILYIVGGPNGAGKTTFAKSFLLDHPIEYLSADLIAYELSPHDVAAVQVEAAREFLRRLAVCLDEKRSCLVESTLSGKSLRQWVSKAKTRGIPRRDPVRVRRLRARLPAAGAGTRKKRGARSSRGRCTAAI